MDLPEPKVVVARLIERFGGRKALFDDINKRMAEFDAVWGQDTDRIGRVLRAHLAVEYFVGMFLTAKNPNLGSIASARLSYAQKLDLLNPKENLASVLLPGLRLLGVIRNRMAHRLRVDITEEDEKAFLAIELFRAMRDELHRGFPPRPVREGSDGTLLVVEQFAKFAAGMLHAAADPSAHIWQTVMAFGEG